MVTPTWMASTLGTLALLSVWGPAEALGGLFFLLCSHFSGPSRKMSCTESGCCSVAAGGELMSASARAQSDARPLVSAADKSSAKLSGPLPERMRPPALCGRRRRRTAVSMVMCCGDSLASRCSFCFASRMRQRAAVVADFGRESEVCSWRLAAGIGGRPSLCSG
eukprot:scaffold1883_cov261-Pinguiococcus_pyrenoidosus.AAC.14